MSETGSCQVPPVGNSFLGNRQIQTPAAPRVVRGSSGCATIVSSPTSTPHSRWSAMPVRRLIRGRASCTARKARRGSCHGILTATLAWPHRCRAAIVQGRQCTAAGCSPPAPLQADQLCEPADLRCADRAAPRLCQAVLEGTASVGRKRRRLIATSRRHDRLAGDAAR